MNYKLITFRLESNPYKYVVKDIVNCKRITLKRATIFNSNYLINDNNNKLYYSSDVVPLTQWTLTNGNYNITQLCSHLQTLIAATYVGTTVVYNSITQKITITGLPSNVNLYFNLNTQLSKILGFNNTQITTNGSAVTSNNSVYLSNAYYTLRYDGIFNRDEHINDANDIIFNDVQQGAMLNYNRDIFEQDEIKNQDKLLSNIEVTIRDEYNNIVDFNNVFPVLQFYIIY